MTTPHIRATVHYHIALNHYEIKILQFSWRILDFFRMYFTKSPILTTILSTEQRPHTVLLHIFLSNQEQFPCPQIFLLHEPCSSCSVNPATKLVDHFHDLTSIGHTKWLLHPSVIYPLERSQVLTRHSISQHILSKGNPQVKRLSSWYGCFQWDLYKMTSVLNNWPSRQLRALVYKQFLLQSSIVCILFIHKQAWLSCDIILYVVSKWITYSLFNHTQQQRPTRWSYQGLTPMTFTIKAKS